MEVLICYHVSKYPNTTYLLHGEKIGIIENATCLADAYKLFASLIGVEGNGVFNSATKHLRPDVKKHATFLKKHYILKPDGSKNHS